MSDVRKYRYIGGAFGSGLVVPVEAKVNGAVVFSGPVATISSDDPQIELTGPEPSDVIAQWETPIDFDGTVDFELTNQSGTDGIIYLTVTQADHAEIQKAEANPEDLAAGKPAGLTGPDVFTLYYFLDNGDPVLNPEIDGNPLVIDRTDPGQFNYPVGPGQTFTCQIICKPGKV